MSHPSPATLDCAIQCLLTDAHVWPAIEQETVQARLHDDTDGQTDAEHWLTVTLRPDAEIQVLVGEQPFVFQGVAKKGASPQTLRALRVVAEGIRRDNLDRPQIDDNNAARSTLTKTAVFPADLMAALDVILETNFFIPTLTTEMGYRRQDDDPDSFERAEGGRLTVYIAGDSDVHLLAGWPSLRFRDYFGGGRSLRTRNALMLLAEAMRREEALASQGT